MKRKHVLLIGVVFIVLLVSGKIISFIVKPGDNNLIFNMGKSNNCISNPNIIFTHDITDFENISYIQPPGGIEEWDKGLILKTHAYIVHKGKTPVYTPVDSDLYKGSNYIEQGIEQFSLFFQASCEIQYYIDHIIEPSQKVKALFPTKPVGYASPKDLDKKVTMKAGDLIGYANADIGTIHFDFGVLDITTKNDLSDLEVMPNMNLHEREYQAVCPFDYYSLEQKQKYYDLFGTIRTEDSIPTRFCKNVNNE